MTQRGNRGIVISNHRSPCRFCPAKFENFDQLRFHAQTEHQQAFYQINRGLAAVDAKLRSLEKLAEEGMVGRRDVPVNTSVRYVEIIDLIVDPDTDEAA